MSWPARVLTIGALFALGACAAGGTDGPSPDGPGVEAFKTPEFLGRPTDGSVTLTLVAALDLTAQVQWGTASGLYSAETPFAAVSAGQAYTAVLPGLATDRQYYYRVRYRPVGASSFSAREEGRFHTARPPGGAFAFTVQADSHLDGNSNLDLYRRTLANVLADAPDFHLDLGDTFMCEKYSSPLTGTAREAPDQATVDARYLYERGNFGIISRSVPIYLVNGNHEGESGWLLDGTARNLAVWATLARQAFFLNPVPDAFYGGDPVTEEFVGRRASWYSWEWGDALFVVLDPYWNCPEQPGRDGWNLTLGERQYQWLRDTLAARRAAWKFVFVHSLVGGLDGQMRGGVEAAPYFEWGGLNEDGTDGFAERRPGWDRPIHALLVHNGVTAVFHGHDHLYARQELNGIVYQEVPQPSLTNFSNGPDLAAAFHYLSGVVDSGSGHLRITVGPAAVRVEYVRAFRPQDENGGRQNGDVSQSYVLTAR